MKNLLGPGPKLPDFELHVTPDQTLSLKEFAGRRVILAFYHPPPTGVPSAATRWRSIIRFFRSSESAARSRLASRSMGHWCHRAFADARKLHFPLLADFEPKGRRSQNPMAPIAPRPASPSARSFVIDEKGVIFWSYCSPIAVNPGADGILDALDRMSNPEANHGNPASPRIVA